MLDQAAIRKAIVAIQLDGSLTEQEKAVKRQALLTGKWAPPAADAGAGGEGREWRAGWRARAPMSAVPLRARPGRARRAAGRGDDATRARRVWAPAEARRAPRGTGRGPHFV